MLSPSRWIRRLPAKVKSAVMGWRNVDRRFPDAALIGIGFNTIWWAVIEQHIDLLVFWHSCTRHGDNRNEHPRSLVNKLRYLKTMEKDETLTAEDRAKVRAIRLRTAELSEMRHDFTHGYLGNIENPVLDWDFTRIRYEGKDLRLVQKQYAIEDLVELTNGITQLLATVSPFVKGLCLEWMNANKSRFASSSAENARP